jgi:hypothetical protein
MKNEPFDPGQQLPPGDPNYSKQDFDISHVAFPSQIQAGNPEDIFVSTGKTNAELLDRKPSLLEQFPFNYLAFPVTDPFQP